MASIEIWFWDRNVKKLRLKSWSWLGSLNKIEPSPKHEQIPKAMADFYFISFVHKKRYDDNSCTFKYVNIFKHSNSVAKHDQNRWKDRIPSCNMMIVLKFRSVTSFCRKQRRKNYFVKLEKWIIELLEDKTSERKWIQNLIGR